MKMKCNTNTVFPTFLYSVSHQKAELVRVGNGMLMHSHVASNCDRLPFTSSEHGVEERKVEVNYLYKRKLMATGSLCVVRFDIRETPRNENKVMSAWVVCP